MKKYILSILIIIAVASSVSAYRSKALTIQVIGAADKTVHFSGWCEVSIGNKTRMKEYISGQNDELQPVQIHGRNIDSCEITNDSGFGTLTLILSANGKEYFRTSSENNAEELLYVQRRKR
jgi:hypothetical protein